jgi:hypothetical protein
LAAGVTLLLVAVIDASLTPIVDKGTYDRGEQLVSFVLASVVGLVGLVTVLRAQSAIEVERESDKLPLTNALWLSAALNVILIPLIVAHFGEGPTCPGYGTFDARGVMAISILLSAPVAVFAIVAFVRSLLRPERLALAAAGVLVAVFPAMLAALSSLSTAIRDC